MRWVLVGPQGAGKSTLLKSAFGAKIMGDAVKTRVMHNVGRLFPAPPPDGAPCAVNFSLHGRRIADFWDLVDEFLERFGADRVAILVTEPTALAKRVRIRNARLQAGGVAKNNEQLSASVVRDAFRETVRVWRARGFTPIFIDTTTKDYRTISGSEAWGVLQKLRTWDETYPQADPEALAKLAYDADGRYQNQPLPFGLSAARDGGRDRSACAERILPASLEGVSVLDIGCAEGAMCFEAERRGATNIVGVERNPKSLARAMATAAALGSRARFIAGSVEDFACEEPFDLVLFLNVLHHVFEPLAVLGKLAAITSETLVIEAPDPSSAKLPGMHDLRDRPVICVGSGNRDKTRLTFMFSPSALRAVLTDHRTLFAGVHTEPSPIKGRFYAVCRKRK